MENFIAVDSWKANNAGLQEDTTLFLPIAEVTHRQSRHRESDNVIYQGQTTLDEQKHHAYP
jgi:hypothetical protein